jgi:hypothetical protein
LKYLEQIDYYGQMCMHMPRLTLVPVPPCYVKLSTLVRFSFQQGAAVSQRFVSVSSNARGGFFCRHNQVVRWVTRLTFARVLSASTWMLTLRRSEALYPLSDVHVTGGAQAPCSCDAGRSSPSASSVADCSGPQLRKDRGTSKGTPLQRRWCSLDRSFTRGVLSTTRRSRDQ